MAFKTSLTLYRTKVLTGALSGLLMLMSAPAWAAPPPERTAFVNLFEWTWKDVAIECETFLGPRGFGAVQVSPPNEHAVIPGSPWYERYQAVSYQLTSRSGTRDEFMEMVRRCKAAGVDVYADAVINHMTGVNRTGQPMVGFAGSTYGEYVYPGLFEAWDFHRCGRNGDDRIGNYQDRWEVQNCNLSQLADLRTESDYVRGRLAAYLNDLIGIGVAGLRIDAAKHMPEGDLQAILSLVRGNFYSYQEIIDFAGEPIRANEYFDTGDVTEFRYARKLADVFNGGKLAWLEMFGEVWGFYPGNKVVVFVDNHDTQRGNIGGGMLSHMDGQKYVLANLFMLAWPYGYPQIMSSFRFKDVDQGPPMTADGRIRTVHGPDGIGCGGEWVCEHRWAPVSNMVAFRNYTRGAPVTKWWSDGGNLIAFGRGGKGFFALNNQPTPVTRWFDTGMPTGSYCDIASGQIVTRSTNVQCTGSLINVNAEGWAEIRLVPNSAVAIHGGSRVAITR